MQDGSTQRYARYGIWGEPVAGRTAFQKAIGTAEGVSSLFGRRYENQLKEAQARGADLDAQEKAATMQGRIGATNTKNETDMQMYPQMQQAKLQQEQQMIKEIMSRTGLNGAQAAEVAARMRLTNTQNSMLQNPTYIFDALTKQVQDLPMGSPKRQILGNLLNQMVGASGPSLNMGGSPKESKKESAPSLFGNKPTGIGPQNSIAGLLDLTVNPFTVSRQSNKGAEYMGKDEEGNPVVYTSPTTPSITNLQNRLSAEQEYQSLGSAMKGLEPYQSLWGASITYPNDVYKARKGDEAAQKRIDNAEQSLQLLTERALLRLRQANPSAQVGKELLDDQIKRMYPHLPSNFIRGLNSTKNIAAATESVDKQLAQANKVAAQSVSSNFPTPVNETPVWAANKNTSGYYDSNAIWHPASENRTPFPKQIQQQDEQPITPDDIAYTAQIHGITEEEVKKRLGLT